MAESLITVVNDFGSLIEGIEGFIIGFSTGFNLFIFTLLIVGMISVIGYYGKEIMRLFTV